MSVLDCLSPSERKKVKKEKGLDKPKRKPPSQHKKPGPRKKTRKLSPEVIEKKQVIAMENLQKGNPAVKKKVQKEAQLKRLALDEQIAKKEANIAKSRDLATRTTEVEAVLKKHDYNPLEEMVTSAKAGKLKPNEKLSVDKYLSDKLYPSLKAIDMQADMNMNVTVTIQSFKDATEAQIQQAHEVIELDDADYEEFEQTDASE